MNSRRSGIVWAIAMGLAGTGQAQTFEVASVKLDPVDQRIQSRYPACSGSTFTALVPVRSVISWAYDIRLGYETPPWTASPSERYSIAAKAESQLSLPQCKAMVQSLLQDRFKLKLHRESKEMPVFFMVTARNGSKLREVEPGSPSEGIRLQGRPLGPKAAWDMSLIGSYLGQFAGQPVVDRTGYKGLYIFNLEFSLRAGDDRPDIFTAVQEQLGLKLEPGRAAVEYVVVDDVQRPSEN